MGSMLEGTDVITLGIGVGTELRSLDEAFYGYNDCNFKDILLGHSLGSNCGNEIGSDECIKLGISDDEVRVTLLGNVDGITRGLDFGSELRSLHLSVGGF